jgi:3-phenylpropionate/cinnamic acid dioxygenase small subunit
MAAGRPQPASVSPANDAAVDRRVDALMYDVQWISDYLAIRDLSARYNYLADTGDGEGYAALFTEDGEFDVVGNRVYRGHAELAACAATAANKTVHVTADPIIEIDGDTARQRSRLISCLRTEDGSRNEFVNTGFYIDELRRTPAGWRFVRRRAEVDLNTEEMLVKLGVRDALAQID